MSSSVRCFWYLLLLSCISSCWVESQVTRPVAESRKPGGSKYLDRDVLALDSVIFGKDATKFETGQKDGSDSKAQQDPKFVCPMDIDLLWTAEVESSVYATPLITDLGSDGQKDVIVTTFVKTVEALSGADGDKLPGWPYSLPESTFHASPLVYDIDDDGHAEVVAITANAGIVFFREDGLPLIDKTIWLRKLRVRKNWYVGLKEQHDHAMHAPGDLSPERHADAESHGAEGAQEKAARRRRRRLMAVENVEGSVERDVDEAWREAVEYAKIESSTKRLMSRPPSGAVCDGITPPCPHKRPDPQVDRPKRTRKLLSVDDEEDPWEDDGWEDWDDDWPGEQDGADEFGGGDQQDDMDQDVWDDTHWEDEDPWWDDEPQQPQDHQQEDGGQAQGDDANAGEQKEEAVAEEEQAWRVPDEIQVEEGDQLSKEAKDSFDVFKHEDDQHEDDHGAPWEDIFDQFPEWDEAPVPQPPSQQPPPNAPDDGSIDVDPHVLCTPVIADVDGDGHAEMVLAVSYYFDREYYSMPEHKAKLPPNTDMSKYVAGAIVVVDLVTRTEKWREHLDLTTDETVFRAYMYSSPSVADVDLDGNLDIAVGTSAGWLYLFDKTGEDAGNSATGRVKSNFPIEMAEIQAQVTLADVNADGWLELVAVDSRGNIAVFSHEGKELWDRRIVGLAAQPASVGDVNGDGQLDIVVATDAGVVWVLDGASGQNVPNFPLRTDDRILAAPLLVRLDDKSLVLGLGLHIVVPSFDGNVYIINGQTACTHKLDVGENSYAMVLVDDLRSSGKTNLLVSTMNGVIYNFASSTPFNPLKATPSQGHHRTGLIAQEGFMGILIRRPSRGPRDVLGRSWLLELDIVDERPPRARRNPSYHVTVSLGGRRVLQRRTFNTPGHHTLEIACPAGRVQGTVVVEMENEQRLYFTDSTPISFNLFFYRPLKWLLIVPFIAMAFVLMFVNDFKTPLPT